MADDDERSKKFSVKLNALQRRDLNAAARLNGECVASWARRTLLEAARLARLEAERRPVFREIPDDKKLSAEDVLRLDVSLRAMGVDLAAVCRED